METANTRGLVAAFVSTFFDLVGYFMLAPLLVLTLTERGIGAGMVGVFSAFGWLGIVLVTPFAGRVAHVLGPRGTFWLSGIMPLIGAIGFLVFDTLAAWFAIYLVMGIASGLRWIVSEAMVTELASAHRRGRIVGLFETMIGATFVVGPAVLALTGTGGSAPFLASIALLAIGVACAFALPCLPRSAHGDATPPGLAGIAHAVRTAPAIMAAGFVGGVFESGISGLLPVYGMAIGFAATVSALLVSASGLGSALMMLPVGELADRTDRRHVFIGCATATLAGTLLLPFAPAFGALAWVIAFVWGGAGGSLYTLAMIDIGARWRGPALVHGTAVLVMSYTLGGTLAPALGGVLIEHTPRFGFPLAFGLIAAFGLIMLMRAFASERRAAATRRPLRG